MILIRTAFRIAKPFLSSATTRCLGVTHNTYPASWITAKSLDNPRRGIFGLGKKKDLSLEDYIGTWHEIESENYRAFLQEAGVKEEEIRVIEKEKAWFIFLNDGQRWTYKYGYLEKKGSRSVNITLGQKFRETFVNGCKMKGIMFYVDEDNSLRETYQTETKPPKSLNIERRLREKDKMAVKLDFNGVVARKKFKRIKVVKKGQSHHLIGSL